MPKPGDHAVGVGPRVLQAHARGVVAIEHVELLEGFLVEQVLDALTRGHLAPGLVSLDGVLATRDAGLGLAGFEFRQSLLIVCSIGAKVT